MPAEVVRMGVPLDDSDVWVRMTLLDDPDVWVRMSITDDVLG